MTTAQTGRIVVGYENELSNHALEWAAREADRTGSSLRIVHAYTTESSFPWAYGYMMPPETIDHVAERVREVSASVLADAAERVQLQHPKLEVVTTLAHGQPAAALVKAAGGARLLVVGARPRHSWPSIGSVHLAVAAHSACPTVVVPTPETRPSDKPRPQGWPEPAVGQVVVGVDDSPECVDAIGFAFAQASERGLELTAVHAWWVDPMLLPFDADDNWGATVDSETSALDVSLASWRAIHPEVKVHRLVGRGRSGDVLTHVSEGAELLVVGSRGRGGFSSLLLGSTSRAVLQQATCPVAVVRRGQLDVLDDQPTVAALQSASTDSIAGPADVR